MEPSTTVPAARAANPWIKALSTPLALGLAALLVAQLLAAIGLALGGRAELSPTALDSPLLGFEPAAVTVIRIVGGDGAAVTLARGDRDWSIAELGDFPADGAKIDSLLDKLAGLKRPLPVGTSAESLKRHKVADDAFERRLTLESGEQGVATLILGDSPGFRRLFARPAGDPVVYDLDLALFDVADRADDWLARDKLRIGRESIERVAASDWVLVKGEDGWRLQGSEQVPDQGAVDDLLSRIGNLSYRGVLGVEDPPEYDQAAPTLDLEIGLAGGEHRHYRISQIKDGQDFVLKASDGPWYFRLSDYDLDGLKDITRAKLLGAEAPGPGSESAAGPLPRAGGAEAGPDDEAPAEAAAGDAGAAAGPAPLPVNEVRQAPSTAPAE